MNNIEENEMLFSNLSTIAETSFDTSTGEYLSNGSIKVINFDKVKNEYTRKLSLSVHNAYSVDAVSKNSNNLVMIEFKNGEVKKNSLRWKIHDSIFIFNDILKNTIDYTRNNVEFILVYNKEKNNVNHGSESRKQITEYVATRANEEMLYFGLDNYYRMLFKDAHTYTIEQFSEYEHNLLSF